MSEQLQEAIQRVVSGSRHEVDIQTIAAALQAGQLTLVTGDGAIGVSRDATNAILVTGSNNIIVRGEVAESLQAILERFSLNPPKAIASVDELVKQVRSHLHDDIHRLHGTMPLWGVDHWMPLGELFVDVNILEELSSSHRADLDDLWQDFTSRMQEDSSSRSLDRIGLGRERQRMSGLEVLAKNTNLMVVGKPGSGKTTYLQRVVTECNAGNLQAHRIPVLIKLREFVEDGRALSYSLERYLERYWHLSAAETQLVLNQGRSLVLLDGLDEVTGADGRAIVKQIKWFTRDYPQVQVIVTCRTQSQESRFERFDYLEVADFNEPQVRAFAEHWFQVVCADLTVGKIKATAFLNQLFYEENKAIRELAITPILLSLTCAVFQQTGKFYSKRSKLYEEGLELLLEQWDKSREIERDEIYRDLSLERKLELLSYLAVKKFEQEQYVLFEQAEIEGYIAEFLGIGLRESRGVLRAIEAQHGLLIERSQKVWSFSHLTFQEYLVATQLCNQLDWNYLINQILETRWGNIFSLIPEITSDIKGLKKAVDEILAEDQKFQEFLTWLEQKTSQTELPCKRIAVKAFYFSLVHQFDRRLAEKLDCRLENMLVHDLDCQSYPNLMCARNLAVEVALIQLDLEFAIQLIDDLNCINQFKKIRNKFRESIENCMENLTPFSEIKKYGWGDSLRALMIQQYNIGYDWDWSTVQTQEIERYYLSNTLLVDCMNFSDRYKDKKNQHIEETLLMPIAEIEKQKREKYW